MKRIVLFVVAIMTMTCGFAKSDNNEATKQMERRMMHVRSAADYDMSFDVRRLAEKLDLTFDQMDAVQIIQNNFNDEMQSAANAHGFHRSAKVRQAVKNDVDKMRTVLNSKQFDTYMMLLGTTLRNKYL